MKPQNAIAEVKHFLHIAVVTETYTPEVNGVALTTANMVESYLAVGHRVTLTRPRQQAGDQAIRAGGYAEQLVLGLPIPGYSSLRCGVPAFAALYRRWKCERPDVVQIVTEGPLGLAAILVARRLGIPAIGEYHTNFQAYSGHYGAGLLSAPIGAYLRLIHNACSMTVAPTVELARQLRADGYGNLRIVARGIDAKCFNPSRRSAELRASWGIDARDRVVAYIGRIANEKNLPLIIESFAAIEAKHPRARLLIVGDGPARRELQERHPEHIYAGMRHGVDLAEHYASADLFLFPSMTETFGNVTIEALASGLPVVAFDMAAAAETIVDGENGYAVQPGDQAAFIARAVELADAAMPTRKRRSQIAASVAARNWPEVMDSMTQVFREAIVRKRRALHTTRLLPA